MIVYDMATASRKEVGAVTELRRGLSICVSTVFLFTGKLAEGEPIRSDTRARIGHTLWS